MVDPLEEAVRRERYCSVTQLSVWLAGLEGLPALFHSHCYSAVIPSSDFVLPALGLMPLMGSTTLIRVPLLSPPISN
jgi:hypothetical protein